MAILFVASYWQPTTELLIFENESCHLFFQSFNWIFLLQNSLRKTLREGKMIHRLSKTLTVTFIYVKQLNKTTFSLWLLSIRI
jgi:hypothetical protein